MRTFLRIAHWHRLDKALHAIVCSRNFEVTATYYGDRHHRRSHAAPLHEFR